MDLSKLTDAELDALEQGRYDLLSDAALDMLEQAQASQAAPAEPVSNAPQAALEGFGQTATMGYLPQLQAAASKVMYPVMNAVTGQDVQPDSYLEERDANLRRQRELAESNPGATMAGKAAGIGATMLAPMGAAKSLGQAVKQGAAMGAAYNPGDVEGVVDPAQGGDRLRNFLIGGAGGAAGYGIGKALEKGGDYAMQMATNRKKYTPGVGTTLADEGLWGTRGMMKKQVGRKLDQRHDDLLARARELPDARVSGREAASEVFDEFTAPMTGGGKLPVEKVSGADLGDLAKAREFADDIAARGDESLEVALQRRRAAGDRAYRGKERVAMGDLPQLSKAEQKAYSSQIKAADPTGQIADLDSRYSALARARTGLNEELSMPKSVMGALSLGLNAVPGGSLAASTAGQLATKSGRTVNRSTPMTLEAFLEGLRKK